ncbi:MAG: hypothetical protein J6C52_07605 [Clostridia bacterium]|nr:hypothetical protein [Clostridia bacterium]
MKKQTTAILLLFAILLAGCVGTEPADTTAAATDAQTTAAGPRDGLPDDLDFGGKEVKFHAGLWYTSKNPAAEYFVEESNGDIVNDAVYYRNQAVEERLNVKLTFDLRETDWGGRQVELNYITQSIMAGDNAFDIAAYISHLMPSVAVGGAMHNLTEMKYLNLSQPWWASGYNNISEVNGNLYFAVGDVVMGMYGATYSMFFNHALIEELKLENPYDLIESGKWTLDKLREMTEAGYGDLNGDTTMDESDRLGLVIQGGNHISGFMEACDVRIFDMAADGESGEYIFGSEHNVNVVDKVVRLVHETAGSFYSKEAAANEYLFFDGNTVFTGGWISDTDYYRELDFDFGVIPYPKYDEKQDKYYSRLGTSCPVVTIPVTCSDTDMASAVLEVMAAEGYYQVRPAYFDTALKEKYSRDEKTKDMIDLIIESITVDFGTIYVYSLNDISDKFKSTIGQNNANWASGTETWKAQVMTSLDTLLKTLKGD